MNGREKPGGRGGATGTGSSRVIQASFSGGGPPARLLVTQPVDRRPSSAHPAAPARFGRGAEAGQRVGTATLRGLPAATGAAAAQQRLAPASPAALLLAPSLVPAPRPGAGTPLPPTIQRKMAARFHADFSDVRIHVGPEAGTLGAIAFTSGSDIYFQPGQYQPLTARGEELLACQLSRVVQQRSGRVQNPFGKGTALVEDAGQPWSKRRGGAIQRTEGPIVPLNLPDIRYPNQIDEQTIRQRSKEYWDYLEYYHLIWGFYPWERHQQRRQTEYVYKPDPKQVARDRIEYLRARRQLQYEAAMDQLIEKHPADRAIWARIEKMTSRREDAKTTFRMFVFLYYVSDMARKVVDEAKGPVEKKRVMLELLHQWEAQFGRQIMHPDYYDDMSNGLAFGNWLRMGLEIVRNISSGMNGIELAEYAFDVFAHDKGYPRAMNYAQPKERGGTLARILNSFLDGEGTVVNSSIFTGKTDTDTFRVQIRKHWATHKGTPKAYFNMWGRILAAIAAEASPSYLKSEVIAYIDTNRQAFRDALSGIIPLEDINDFLDNHLEKACDEAGLM